MSLDLPYYNNTNYPLSLKEQLGQLPYTEEDAKHLRYHQFITKEFFTKNKYARGLLICHGMGQGKTKLAVSIADNYRTYDPERRIIVLLSKSLEGNFRNTIQSYTNKDDEYINKNYKFVSLNASNMYKQVQQLEKTKEEIEQENRLSDFVDSIKKSTLDNSLLIIDEAHNLFNAITNGAKNAVGLYDMIINSKNLKLIFMTGTPIINDPFELVPCFNMLRGWIILDNVLGGFGETYGEVEDGEIVNTIIPDDGSFGGKSKRLGGFGETYGEVEDGEIVNTIIPNGGDDEDGDDDYSNDDYSNNSNDSNDSSNRQDSHIDTQPEYHARSKQHKFNKKSSKHNTKSTSKDRILLFSESKDEFDDFFVDYPNKTVKNKDKFTNRIFGLSSYYGDIYFELADTNKVVKQGFPEKLPTIIERIPMSDVQFARYIVARNQELEETKKGFKGKDTRFSSSVGGSSTYRVKSRQISNYCIPEYALGPVRGAKARTKYIDKITNEDLLDTNQFSPKMGQVLHNINNNPNKLGMFYSQFVSGEGIAVFARILEANGWQLYNNIVEPINEYGIENKKPKNVYAILSGDIDPEERVNLIQQFNRKENTNGEIIRLLLLSGAVAEGIDLKRIRHVHILEPFWNYARINQVETRAIRYLSHTDLLPEDQNVQVYIYLSDYPKNYPQEKIKEPTTDVDLYTRSIDNQKIINKFMLAIAESSIDCSLHFKKLDDSIKKNIQCKLCAPTNQQLFHPLINRDMTIPSTCQAYHEKKVEVDEFIYKPTGEKFYYKFDPKNKTKIDLYFFNKKLNGYTNMPRNYPLYGSIYSAVYEMINDAGSVQ